MWHRRPQRNLELGSAGNGSTGCRLSAVWRKLAAEHPEKAVVTQRITRDICGRIKILLDLGLGYLSLDRSTPTLSPGELQRLRLATQVRSNLFGVVYVLDEPSAGLHPADTESLLAALKHIYGALDSDDSGPEPADRPGLAA